MNLENTLLLQNSKRKKLLIKTAIITVLLLIGITAVYLFLNNDKAQAGTLGDPLAEPRSYIGKVVQMKPVQHEVKTGKVFLNLSDVDENSMVGFSISSSHGIEFPMMAYITSTGRLFVGSSVCECGGETFSLAGMTLVCNTCRTTYDIENQKFLSGVSICGKYPPVAMQAVVNNGIIEIFEAEILKGRQRE